MAKQLLAALAVIASGIASASAAEISATFDDDREGFTLSGGFLNRLSAGGNPGGALQAVDSQGTEMMLTLPSQFIVPLTSNSMLSFDAKETDNPNGNFAGFGRVTVTGNGDSATADFFSGDLQNIWTTVDVTFDDSSLWGKTDSELANILSNLTSIVINIESGNQVSEILLIDNVILKVGDEIPVPAAALLFAPVAAAVIRRRRRA